MRRLGLVALGLLLFFGCASKNMNIVYTLPDEKPLKLRHIFLQVDDVRTDKEILSPAVRNMKVFSGVGGFVNLVTKASQGGPQEFKGARIKKAFEEALRQRLESLGVGLPAKSDPEKGTILIEVERFWLDLKGNSFKAEVTYAATFSKGGKALNKERISGRTHRYNLLGLGTGEKTLSEAFSMAVNNLDLDSLNK
ncbi:MAG: hypothetical protein SV487_10920 [Thermodesulfobacteriota bacterium]|nr:hypothetical protein [Thermodesulfobacteriota bacterium]